MVRSFLDLSLEESFTIDYKRNIEAASETVAAMANTHGGIVLIGIDNDPKDPNLPGPLRGVQPSDKDKLVNKMVTVFDPPGWCPDVIPVTLDGITLLVVRVNPDTVARPLLYRGAAKVRVDGRNITADRRLLGRLFEEADAAPTPLGLDPRFAPDQHLSPRHRQTYREDPPDVVIRASASRPLRRDGVRRRLGGATIDALTASLSDRQGSPFGASQSPLMALTELMARTRPGERVGTWKVDPEYGNSRFVRISAGHYSRRPDQPLTPSMRVECSAELAGAGSNLDVHVDILHWLGEGRLSADLWTQSAYEVVRGLVRHALPALTRELIGTSSLSTPPIELHIAPGGPDLRPLADSLDTVVLGEGTGPGRLSRGSDYLSEELVGVDDLKGATLESLGNIALDWRFLRPQLPEIQT
ncbi:ATP-binding protein [Streptomyces sp. NPDC090054]|uniref:ATP-binding protein n=1 Tax=Streptomyces sp. NPDC090054 TaxID=3365933 RepID=UPI003823B0AB